MYRIPLTLALFALAACANDDVEQSYVDEGSLCFGLRGEALPPSDDLQLDADEPLHATVALEMCLSSSCDLDREFTCAAKLDGNQLTITSSLRWTSKTGTCTADCGTPAARCDVPGLPAGTYDVVFGEERRTLQIPGKAGPCLNTRN